MSARANKQMQATQPASLISGPVTKAGPHTRKLLVFAGHTGGHLFPAQAFAESFRKRHSNGSIYLVTSRKGKSLAAQMPQGLFREVFFLDEFPFPSRVSPGVIFFLFKLVSAFWNSLDLLFRVKPDLCVGFGSYVSFPGILLAAWFRIPTLIHEQNLIPGKASRWLASKVRSVAVSFEETFLHPPLRSRCVTGLPLRSQLCESARLGRKKSKESFNILIAGGSQGAHRLNGLILQALDGLPSAEKKKMAVIHIAGREDYDWVRQSYQKMEMTNEVYPFCDEMQALYQKADMAVTRAGANTLFELLLFRLPALVIPYPFAEAHQAANAAYFESRGAIVCRCQETLTAEVLRREILHFMKNPEERERLSDKMEKMASANAAARLVDLAEGLLPREKTYAYR